MGRKNYKTKQCRDQNNNSFISLGALTGAEIVTKGGRRYQVRRTFDGSSVYKCPGCNHEIAQGKPSLTVIEQDHIFGDQAAIDERRHWHESCWKAYRP
ncbi:MAG: hypothetical protein LBC50_01250 [Candidatus Ancillula sp.]|nr:hypothetical protein [Candidatus Ancillula sp.]